MMIDATIVRDSGNPDLFVWILSIIMILLLIFVFGHGKMVIDRDYHNSSSNVIDDEK